MKRARNNCYSCHVDLSLILAVVAAVWLLAVAFAVGRMAWRFFHGNEEPQPGGSLGRQLFGGSAKPK